jgi:NAD-dependent dihydropyrimidine dehydrogenase PreA subunit
VKKISRREFNKHAAYLTLLTLGFMALADIKFLRKKELLNRLGFSSNIVNTRARIHSKAEVDQEKCLGIICGSCIRGEPLLRIGRKYPATLKIGQKNLILEFPTIEHKRKVVCPVDAIRIKVDNEIYDLDKLEKLWAKAGGESLEWKTKVAKKSYAYIDKNKCLGCGLCEQRCRVGAIKFRRVV